MKKITQVLNSPKKIGIFAIVTVLIVGAIAITTIKVGASVNKNKTIGIDKGVNIALQDAGLNQDEITNLVSHYDSDDGIAAYDVSFVSGNMKYEYTIKASDGTILEADKESVNESCGYPEKEYFDEQADNQSEQSDEPLKTPDVSKDNSNQSPTSKYIGADKAKSIALDFTKVSPAKASFTKAKLDKEDGISVYEVEFYADGIEYDFEINAVSGEIIEYSSESEYDD